MSYRSPTTLQKCLFHKPSRLHLRIVFTLQPRLPLRSQSSQELSLASSQPCFEHVAFRNFSAIPRRDVSTELEGLVDPVPTDRQAIVEHNQNHDPTGHLRCRKQNGDLTAKLVDCLTSSPLDAQFRNSQQSIALQKDKQQDESDITTESPIDTVPRGQSPKPSITKLSPNRAAGRWRNLYLRLNWPDDWDLIKARDSLQEYRTLSSSFIGSGDSDELRRQWLQREDSNDFRPEILIGCLTDSAKSSLLLLSSIDEIPWWVRVECLLYLRRTRLQEIETEPGIRETYQQQLSMLRDHKYWPAYSMTSVYLHLLVRDLPKDETIQLIRKYLDIYPSADIESHLYIVDCFTRHGDAAGAISVLRCLPAEEWQRSSPSLLGRCINLLALDTVEWGESGQNFKILPALLEMGLRPNDLLHNVVIQNAVKQGLVTVAWDLYRYMNREMIKITPHTYLALLKDSFLRQDVQGLNEMMTAMHQNPDLAKEPYLVAYAMNIVRDVSYNKRKADPTECLQHLLAIYDRAYDRAPLVKLGILHSDNASSKDKSLPEPGPAGLAFTLWSFVLVQRREKVVTRLWEVLIDMIKRGDTSILEAAKYDVFYSGFILFYARDQHNLTKGLKVLQYMLEQGLCHPSETTWSQAICGFLRHYQEVPADRIRELMQLRGVEVREQAWKFLLSKYPDSVVAENLRHVLDERAMPKGLEEAMGGVSGNGREAVVDKTSDSNGNSNKVYEGWSSAGGLGDILGFGSMTPSKLPGTGRGGIQ